MSKPTRVTIGLAALGLAIAAALFAYLEFTNYARLNGALLVAAVTLCPPSLLSILFIGVEPHTNDMAFIWLVVALINGALYSAVGSAIGHFVWKAHGPTAGKA